MVISKEIAFQLERRADKIIKNYRDKAGICNGTELAEKILSKYLFKKDEEDRCNRGSNTGMAWTKFLNEHAGTIYSNSKGMCHYCKQLVTRKQATYDHLHPVKRSGANKISNLVISCKWCNVDKGLLTEEEYFYKQLVNKSKGIEVPKPE